MDARKIGPDQLQLLLRDTMVKLWVARAKLDWVVRNNPGNIVQPPAEEKDRIQRLAEVMVVGMFRKPLT
jgi:hypothetical protein